MKLPVMKPDVSRRRFSLPNAIWTWKLRPPAFAVLAYLQYHSCRKIHGVPAMRELAMHTKLSAKMAEQQVNVLVDRGFVTSSLFPTWPPPKSGNFFTLPDELFYLNLGHGPITVYAYLLYCEDRRTHQCHPGYKTISAVTGLAVNTVMKCVTTLTDKQLITVEHTSYIDNNGMKWNGNNLYTILPIQRATDVFHQRQLAELELAAERQRAAKLLRERESPA